MLSVERPFALLLLFAIPLWLGLSRYGIPSSAAFGLTLGDWKGRTFCWNDPTSRLIRACSKICALAAFAVLVLALSEPVLRRQRKVFVSRGTDIIFALDVSPSMAARDIAGGSRLDAARLAVESLVARNQGPMYGLVALGSEAALIVPPTADTSYFLERMRSLVIGEMGDGSALGTGISAAVYHLANSRAPKKCVVLITDGENNAGAVHPETAARLAGDEGVSLYVLGLGTRGTVPLEYADPKTGKVYSGTFDSSFDTLPLARIAALGSGRYFDVESAAGLGAALESVAASEAVTQQFFFQTEERRLSGSLLSLCAALAAAWWFLRRILLKEFV